MIYALTTVMLVVAGFFVTEKRIFYRVMGVWLAYLCGVLVVLGQ